MATAAKRLLIVDDEPGVRQFLKDLLQAAGYLVDTADNGRAALMKMQSQPFDLVLLDLIMPEREGIETLSALRSRNSPIPVIAMSGVPQYLRMTEYLGAVAMLSKPFNNQVVLSTVKQALAEK